MYTKREREQTCDEGRDERYNMTPKVCIHREREQKCDEDRDERYDMTS